MAAGSVLTGSHSNQNNQGQTALRVYRYQQRNPDIIFIGAGPVGLWTAIQIRLLNPAVEIKMFESTITIDVTTNLGYHCLVCGIA